MIVIIIFCINPVHHNHIGGWVYPQHVYAHPGVIKGKALPFLLWIKNVPEHAIGDSVLGVV